ncbi:androgen-dependent TFPI-regulating protein-like [Diabrotica undecimpunctata]|uniref:androgen-dependent TFPI-regulating protein-like n=1 Tax=Diabrotica undecimpunctata TaxID=50387 RepID=UPI003B632806
MLNLANKFFGVIISKVLGEQKPIELSKQFLFHFVAVVHHLYVAWYSCTQLDFKDVTEPKILIIANYAPAYFTTWNFTMQLCYFTLSAWCDLQDALRTKHERLSDILKIKSYIYTIFVFSSGILVTSLFWGLYHIDNEYIYPQVCQNFFPSILNHSFHTVIFVFVVIEAIYVDHPWYDLKLSVVVYTIYFIAYHLVYLGASAMLGYFLYPVFNLMSATGVATFIFSYYVWSIILIVICIQVEKWKGNSENTRKSALKKCE